MRRKKNTVIWPAYFDSSLTRSEGRRVPKALAIADPTAKKIYEVVESLGLNSVVEPEAAHPTRPWKKDGRMLVETKASKPQTITQIAKRLRQSPRRKK
ncbi:MAG: signal recognition particle subunit SRP19/SEC65 family protein [Candidatus Bathyarchaeota archaeon]|nr:MAG: signal recognition particle subunit SRP19/SEC65 family protein [Candidatus Bathyarchaeota archaeon]